ncbi:hypothetical protein [Streptomyces palmae]|uniref:Uncharacterized protein n=1 Tax=Streptomyces palmae TaxID=1701085 RepID=A0A4Z0H9U4_9ACTN|nr:hypothetical protein [Streptomyces palmae]TGB14595.1 hypothetical protein E4099_08130 [Streptomyces palmae]
MAKNRKGRNGGPNKQAARAARRRREQRLLEMDPLFHGNPPYEGYREWLVPSPLTGRFELAASAPMESRQYFARIEELLLPIYRGRLPVAATHLDDWIKSGVIALANADGPQVPASVVPVAEFAQRISSDDGHGHHEVCPQLSCCGGVHVSSEHRVWVHLHQLHAAGRLLLNDHDAIRLTAPPRQPGDKWQFLSTVG